jgi:hypothetical protein
MKMVGHKTKGIKFQVMTGRKFFQKPKKEEIIGVLYEQGFLSGCTLGDMKYHLGNINFSSSPKEAFNFTGPNKMINFHRANSYSSML